MAEASISLSPESRQPRGRADHNSAANVYADVVSQGLPGQTKSEGAPETASYTGANGDLDSTGTMIVNGETDGDPEKAGDEKKVVYEECVNDRGDNLISVKNESHGHNLKREKQLIPRLRKNQKITTGSSSPLASGRRAGAGWQRSAYVTFNSPPDYCTSARTILGCRPALCYR